jgi:hypothetical protein
VTTTVGDPKGASLTVHRAARASRASTEPFLALGVGLLLLVVGLIVYEGLVPGFGAASTLFAAVLAVSGILLIAGGLYARSALRAVPHATPSARPAARVAPPALAASPSPGPDDDLDAPSGFVVPVDLDDEPPFLTPPDSSLPPIAAGARGAGAAADAVRRSARADEAYRAAIQPMSGSIAFAPVIQSNARGPAPPSEANPRLWATAAPRPPSGSPSLGRTDSILDDPPLTVRAPPTRALLSPARSGATATLAQIPQPPARSLMGGANGRRCTGCDSAIPGDLNVPLCWGCGRVLCTSCYWRNRSGPGLHRCPECAARGSSHAPAPAGPVPGVNAVRPGASPTTAMAGPSTGGRSSP